MNNMEQYLKELEELTYNHFIKRIAKEIELYIKYLNPEELNSNNLLNIAKDEITISKEKLFWIWNDVFNELSNK